MNSHRLKTFWQAGLVFSALAMILVPGPLDFFGWQRAFADAVVLPILRFAGGFLFPTETWFQEISSDSIYLWLLLALLIPISSVLGFRLFRSERGTAFLQILLAYFLSFVLLNYGIDKVFKAQFYLPEPNILFTPFGMLDRDILYWSTMGISYEYNVFLGLAEVLSAMLILFRKTRIVGLLLATSILVNVVAINFSFDISVKAFSSLLLLISLLLLAPFGVSLFRYFFQHKSERVPELPSLYFSRLSSRLSQITKITLVAIVLLQAIYPFWNSGVYNDDFAERPFLHGAYRVVNSSDPNLKMIFVHRDGYLIFQDHELRMKDFKLEIDPTRNSLMLKDYDGSKTLLGFEHDNYSGHLDLSKSDGDFYVKSEAVDWQNLPALHRQFHLSID
ncbi:MAG: hypothetical protein WBG42_08040 [Cryomorphaceae bacterium]